jgi:hypothetical protein
MTANQPEEHTPMTSMTELFGEPISVYTVADGVADDVMVLAPPADTDEAGYRLPVTFTKAAWRDLVEWDDEPCQDEAGRLWDVLTMVRRAAKAAATDPGSRHAFSLYRVPFLTKSGNRSRAQEPKLARAHVVCQAFDRSGRPCLTILLPGED